MIRPHAVIIASSALLIFGGCNSAPSVTFRQSTETGSTVFTPAASSATSASVSGTGDLIGTYEVMPQTTDSLEVGTATGAAIPVTLTQDLTILYGDADDDSSETPSIPTLLEFFDYDCEYCREHALSHRPWIDRTFVATKRMNVERIFVPLSPLGFRLAQAAICADDEGKLSRMDRALITEQPSNEAGIFAIAKKIGLKTDPFARCMRRTDLLPEKRILADGTEIKRVPAFRMGDVRWEGILTEEEMREKMEELLEE